MAARHVSGRPLLEQAASKSQLLLAYTKLRKRPESHGIDNMKFKEFATGLDSRLAEISVQLLEGRYRFQPLRAVALPKKHSAGWRPLYVPTIRDRVVQRAMLDVIDVDIKRLVSARTSHAFLRQRGVATAVRALKRLLQAGNVSVIVTDIVNFFPSIDAESVLKRLVEELPDKSLAPALTDCLNWELQGVSRLSSEQKACFPGPASSRGLPQGSALSPLLSNLFLADIDQEIGDRKLGIVRYADDIAITARTRSEVIENFEWLKSELGLLKLTVYDPRANTKKAFISDDVRRSGVAYLSVYLWPQPNGVRMKPTTSAVDHAQNRIRRLLMDWHGASLVDRVRAVNDFGRSWVGTFAELCSMRMISKRLYEHADNSLVELLHDKDLVGRGYTPPKDKLRFIGITRDWVPGSHRPRLRKPRPIV